MSEIAVVVSGNIQNQAKVDAYKSVAGPIMKKHGAIMPPQSYNISEIVAGRTSPTFMLKIEFPNKEKALAAFNDPEYMAVINERDDGFGDLRAPLLIMDKSDCMQNGSYQGENRT